MSDLETLMLVLNEQKYGESSKIIRVLTRDHGKISIMVKGALRAKSSYVSISSRFAYSKVLLSKGKSFYYIKYANLLDSNYKLRNNFFSIIYASYLAELLDRSLLENYVNKKIFDLTIKTLELLCQEKNQKNQANIILAYNLKFISFLGYRPNLKSNMGNVFSISEGGISSKNGVSGLTYNLSKEEVNILNSYLLTSLDKLDFNISKNSLKKLENIIIEYIKYNLEIDNFNSLSLI